MTFVTKFCDDDLKRMSFPSGIQPFLYSIVVEGDSIDSPKMFVDL